MKLFQAKIYTSLDDIPVDNFFGVVASKDLKWMYVNRPRKKHAKIVQETWMKIYDNYIDATQNNESLNYFRLLDEVSYLKHRHKVISALIYSLNEINKEIIGEELVAWGVIFNPKLTVKAQAENLKRFLRAADNKILRKTSELEAISEKDKKEPLNILKQKVELEHIVGIKINTKTMFMSEWIEIVSLAKSILEMKKQAAQNG